MSVTATASKPVAALVQVGVTAAGSAPVPAGPGILVRHCAFLDQIKVVDGVCRQERIDQADDLIVGDAYRFPAETLQTASNVIMKERTANVHLLSHVDIGSQMFDAARKHHIVLMSDNGHTVEGDILAQPCGRTCVALRCPADPRVDYTLIDVSPPEADTGVIR